ncbi:hypothetical protein ACFWJM_07275 [Streptomyces sp. NPDC127077]|uniref:hypothetical protein n=1 Tax=Streptomyces sp. NPDC127077 TaxID=3347131 RepID=UPI0036519EDC
MRTSPGLPRRAIAGRSTPAAFRAPRGPVSAAPTADRPLAGRQLIDRALTDGVRPANSATTYRSYAQSVPPHDSDLLGLGKEISGRGDQLAFRIVSQRDAAWVEALFAAVDAKQ